MTAQPVDRPRTDPGDVDTLVRAVFDGDVPFSTAVATLHALGLDPDGTAWAVLCEARDALALIGRVTSDPDWDVLAHLDRHPVPGVTVEMLTDYVLGCVESDYNALVRQLAGCPVIGVVR